VVTPVRLGDKMLIRCFSNYVANRHLEGKPIGDDWIMVTQKEFDSFRIDPKNLLSLASNAPPNIPATIASKQTSAVQYTPADMFRRGMKRDATLFPTLKDEKFNDSWHRSFVNQARAQDVSELLDSNYVPTTASEHELFTKKKKYVSSILESKVLTDRGKAIVRAYEGTFDAQEVYKRLTEHHLKSTKARIGFYYPIIYHFKKDMKRGVERFNRRIHYSLD
jgi:hypothetical protein